MNWPDQISTAALQRMVDIHMITQLERGGLAQLDAWQAAQWHTLHEWLKANTPWWAERLENGHTGWQNPHLWPILSRRELMEMVAKNGAAPMPRHHGPLREGSTSGSSGMPVRYFNSQFAQRLIDHQYAADHARQGRDTYATRAVIDSRTPEHEGTHIAHEPRIEDGVGLMIRRRNNQFSMREHMQWLVDQKPAYLATNPDWLETLLDEAIAQGWPMPHIDQVMSYGSTVSPTLRSKARKWLGASVRDRYSCEECGPLAFQCPKSDEHYHVAMLNVRLEVVDDAGAVCAPGETGRVLVTALHQYATPLVRYDIGDVAALHPTCPGCGAGISALSNLLGRRRFLLRLPDGQMVYVRVLAREWLSCAPIVEHQLVQITPTDLRADVVMDRPITPGEEQAIIAMLRKVVTPDLNYTVRQVAEIVRTASTKRQEILNLIA